MNERLIFNLAKQADPGYTGIDDDNMGHALVGYEAIEKFAQLLIADAINTVEKRFMGDLNREDIEVRRCVEALKNHFGVYDEQR